MIFLFLYLIFIFFADLYASVLHGPSWQTSIEPSGYVPPNLIELRRIEFISKGVLCWAMARFEGKTAAYSVPVYSLAPHHSALVVRGSHGTIRESIPPNSGAESKNQAFSFSQSICIAGRSTAFLPLLPQGLTGSFCVITIGFPLSLPW